MGILTLLRQSKQKMWPIFVSPLAYVPFCSPDPWVDPESRSTLGLYRSIRVQNWGSLFLASKVAYGVELSRGGYPSFGWKPFSLHRPLTLRRNSTGTWTWTLKPNSVLGLSCSWLKNMVYYGTQQGNALAGSSSHHLQMVRSTV